MEFKNFFKKEKGPERDLNATSKKLAKALKNAGPLPAKKAGMANLFVIGLTSLCLTASSCNSGIFEDVNVQIEAGGTIDTDGDNQPDGYWGISVGGSTYYGWSISGTVGMGDIPIYSPSMQWQIEESIPQTGIAYVSSAPNNMGGTLWLPGFGYHSYTEAPTGGNSTFHDIFQYVYEMQGFAEGSYWVPVVYHTDGTTGIDGVAVRNIILDGDGPASL